MSGYTSLIFKNGVFDFLERCFVVAGMPVQTQATL